MSYSPNSLYQKPHLLAMAASPLVAVASARPPLASTVSLKSLDVFGNENSLARSSS
jgi:hypothetical protein